MALFSKKTWKNRMSEYPTRRKLTKENGTTELVTVARSEGNVSQEGDAFSADNMNDLETRIQKAIGTGDIPKGLGTDIISALTALNTGLSKRRTVYTSLDALGITSAFIPDIIDAMPKNTSFMTLINSTGIYDNKDNKLNELKISSGILTIEKTESYTRTIVTTNNSGGSNGCLYIGSINTNTKEVNGWYEIDANHTHDDRYYTEVEINNLLSGKANSGHTHNYLPLSGGTVTGALKINNLIHLQIGSWDIYGESSQMIKMAPPEGEYVMTMGVTDNTWALCPWTDGTYSIGTSGHRVNQVYARNSAISTSDRNLKQDITLISEKYLDFFALLQPITYRFKDGSSGRVHVGYIAQDVEAAMAQVKLSDLDFAGFCRDEIDGKIFYSLRYEEFIALNTAVIQRQQARITSLEQRMEDIEKKMEILIQQGV